MGGGYSLEDLGINILAQENGYICLGKTYNNIAFQWGKGDGQYEVSITLPIQATILCINVCDCYGEKNEDGNVYAPITSVQRNNTLSNQIIVNSALYNTNTTNSSRTNLGYFYYFVICKIDS